jgi:hypothetical protein
MPRHPTPACLWAPNDGRWRVLLHQTHYFILRIAPNDTPFTDASITCFDHSRERVPLASLKRPLLPRHRTSRPSDRCLSQFVFACRVTGQSIMPLGFRLEQLVCQGYRPSTIGNPACWSRSSEILSTSKHHFAGHRRSISAINCSALPDRIMDGADGRRNPLTAVVLCRS